MSTNAEQVRTTYVCVSCGRNEGSCVCWTKESHRHWDGDGYNCTRCGKSEYDCTCVFTAPARRTIVNTGPIR